MISKVTEPNHLPMRELACENGELKTNNDSPARVSEGFPTSMAFGKAGVHGLH